MSSHIYTSVVFIFVFIYYINRAKCLTDTEFIVLVITFLIMLFAFSKQHITEYFIEQHKDDIKTNMLHIQKQLFEKYRVVEKLRSVKNVISAKIKCLQNCKPK